MSFICRRIQIFKLIGIKKKNYTHHDVQNPIKQKTNAGEMSAYQNDNTNSEKCGLGRDTTMTTATYCKITLFGVSFLGKYTLSSFSWGIICSIITNIHFLSLLYSYIPLTNTDTVVYKPRREGRKHFWWEREKKNTIMFVVTYCVTVSLHVAHNYTHIC